MAMIEKIDDTTLDAWRAFINAHAAIINHIEQALEAEGKIPLSSYDVLVALNSAPQKRLRMHELADKVVLSRSGLTRLVDRLEKEGFLCRERPSSTSGEDRRGAYAVLTDAGIEALRQAWPIYAHGIQQYFAGQLSPEEIELITAAFGRVNEAARRKEPR
jgi:DNA-binding MarR family transcriptional regulator